MNIRDKALDAVGGIPTLANLQRKIDQLEKEKVEFKDEIASVKDDLREARATNAKLAEQLKAFTTPKDLNEIEIKVLLLLDQHGGSLIDGDLFILLKDIGHTRLNYHLDELNRRNFVHRIKMSLTRPGVYRLMQPGRAYLVDNDLVS